MFITMQLVFVWCLAFEKKKKTFCLVNYVIFRKLNNFINVPNLQIVATIDLLSSLSLV
jgi:hypothetical protein